jgi:hypothetical protein
VEEALNGWDSPLSMVDAAGDYRFPASDPTIGEIKK